MDVLVLEIVTCLILTTLCLSQSASERRLVVPQYQEPIKINELLGSGDVMRLPDDYTRTQSSDTKNFRNLVFSNDMSKIYAGTQESLLIIDPSDLTVDMSIDFSESCVSSLPETCYVRLIQPLEDDCLYVCHSDLPRARCCFAWTNGTVNTCKAVDIAPEDTTQNFTITYSKEEKKFFTGIGVTSASIQSDTEFRFDNVTEDCNTVQKTVDSVDTGSTWLNVPNFVGEPIEYGDHVYFFFREFASEAINGGRITYSRVGRVCKNDTGGDPFTELANEFTTYQKARLDCSLEDEPNEYPETTSDNLRTYDFNEIQGTYYINKTIFAVFTNPRTSLGSSSAVCAYSIDEIDELFNKGEVLGQADDKQLWTERAREATAFQCSVKAPPGIYKFLEDYPLVNLRVPNKLDYRDTSVNYLRNSDAPILFSDDVRFSQIVVDNNDALHLGTERGTVIKASLSENKIEAILESEVDFNVKGLPEAPVLSMLKKDNGNFTYIGTANSVCGLSLDFEQPATSGTINLLNSPCRNVTTMTPQESCSLTIPVNRTVNLNFAVSAIKGVDLNFRNAECNLCNLESFSSNFSSTCGGEDFATVNLVLVTKTSADDCSCSATFATGTDNRIFRTSITISNDEILDSSTAGDCFNEVQDYDNEIMLYKYNLTIWKDEIIRKSNASVNTYCNDSCG